MDRADPLLVTRRELLTRSALGVGAIALASLVRDDLFAAEPIERAAAGAGPAAADPLAPKRPHFAPAARHIIHVHLVGAPSQLDLFDYKPALAAHDGQLCPQELIAGQRFAFLQGHPKLLGPRFKFQRHGECGLELSELLPHLGGVADELALVKTVHTEEFNHGPAQCFLHTGFGRLGRPGIGAWTVYGLGSESRDLPAYVVFVTGLTPGAGTSLWGSGFLPSVYQGVQFRSRGEPVLFAGNPEGIDRTGRRRMLDRIQQLNQLQLLDVGDPEIATRIASYEMAFRMQASVPDLMDLTQEPAHVHALYGSEPGKPSFAANCLLARRLVERGVRCVQLFDEGWDHHGSIATNLPRKCAQVDRALAGLVRDLKQRGLLEETLLVVGAEFGRTPMLQGEADQRAGRDHHKDAFTVLLAGGGVAGGTVVGRTDELGYYPVEYPVHVRDLHATVLHLLGIDHTRLTYKYQGREFRLTDIGGEVVKPLLRRPHAA